MKSDDCEYSSRFCEQLFTSSFFPLINRPSRITQHTATLIDNIFTNDLELIDSSVNGLIFSDISDHLPIFLIACLSSNNNDHKTGNSHFKRIINEDNLDLFQASVKNISWESTFEANDPCESHTNFHNNLKIAIDKSFPLVKMKDKFVNHTKSPWMTNGIFKSISNKNKLYKKFLKKPTHKNEIDYKKYKNKLNHVIKTAKKPIMKNNLLSIKMIQKKHGKLSMKCLTEIKQEKIYPLLFYKRVQISMLRIPRKLLTNLTNIS